MVFDHYQPYIPYQPPLYWTQMVSNSPADMSAADELRQLIAEFRQAVAAAKVVDKLTGQPDCEDPVKATLEERVRRLEELIGAQEKRP
jgi:hypothetical protein